jgi:hypothetical protein
MIKNLIRKMEKKLCKFFIENKCKFGNECKFLHTTTSSLSLNEKEKNIIENNNEK